MSRAVSTAAASSRGIPAHRQTPSASTRLASSNRTTERRPGHDSAAASQAAPT
ncbi:hypothetical protein [Streptomyces caniscabiei]